MHECILCIYVSKIHSVVRKPISKRKDLIIRADVLTSSEDFQQERSYMGEDVLRCSFCSNNLCSRSHVAYPLWRISLLGSQFSLRFSYEYPIFQLCVH
jgi:hypothetical protein